MSIMIHRGNMGNSEKPLPSSDVLPEGDRKNATGIWCLRSWGTHSSTQGGLTAGAFLTGAVNSGGLRRILCCGGCGHGDETGRCKVPSLPCCVVSSAWWLLPTPMREPLWHVQRRLWAIGTMLFSRKKHIFYKHQNLFVMHVLQKVVLRCSESWTFFFCCQMHQRSARDTLRASTPLSAEVVSWATPCALWVCSCSGFCWPSTARRGCSGWQKSDGMTRNRGLLKRTPGEKTIRSRLQFVSLSWSKESKVWSRSSMKFAVAVL